MSTLNANQIISAGNQTASPALPAAVVTDSELVRMVSHALRQTGRPALGELQVSTRLGVVTLQGRVPNSYLKVLAMTTALTVTGAWWVVNCLEISVCPS